MDKIQPRFPRDGRPLACQPLSPMLEDYEIRALGGSTTAFDTMPGEMQKTKAPVSVQDRIVELTRENARLRGEVQYYKGLVKKVLHPVWALLNFHEYGLSSAVGEFNMAIQTFNAEWQADQQ